MVWLAVPVAAIRASPAALRKRKSSTSAASHVAGSSEICPMCTPLSIVTDIFAYFTP
jgi:hypothetical protein